MTEKHYYSSERKGFFYGNDRDTYEKSLLGWPEDAVEITLEYKEELFEKQAQGYEILGDDKGYPVAKLKEISIKDQNENTVLALKQEADAVIQPLLGYALSGILSEEEQSKFKSWNIYRKALDELDTSLDTLELPTKPEE